MGFLPVVLDAQLLRGHLKFALDDLTDQLPPAGATSFSAIDRPIILSGALLRNQFPH